MFIIGVVLGLASINFAQDPRTILKTEAEQLSLLMQQARDEAIITGASIAWKSENGSYAFFELGAEDKWRLMNDAFRARQWPASVEVANVRINGVKAPLNEALVFTPSGFNQPFELTLALNNARVGLNGDALGRIKIE